MQIEQKTTTRSKLIYIFCLPLYVSTFILSIAGFILEDLAIYFTFKTAFMPTLSLFLFLYYPRPLNKVFYLLQLAFLFAMLGDALIVLQVYHPLFFSLGACSFLIQHNFYIWINRQASGPKNYVWMKPYWGLPNIAYVILFSLIYFAEIDKILKAECMIYAFFVVTALVTACNRDMKNRFKYWMVLIGFAIFLLSDCIILFEKFVMPLTNWQSSSVLVTYYMAQTMILYGNLPDKD
jgi:hypothetical protein